MTDYRDRLREIKTFSSLVKFLRDDLDWPIAGTDDFEDLTFDYTPEELGIDPANAAKIEEIKRLRPLVANQPWGVFFVKFEPKQLPVVALRRILNGVVVRKRATSSAADQQKWATDDLLFISNYGENAERRISFAHFSRDPTKQELPTLRVLAWDDLDTPLHLDHAADTMVQRLAWPGSEDEWDDETWRERWSSAFELRHREVITTSKVLAVRLAGLARAIRDRIKTVLAVETEDGPVTKLMKAFQEALVHDLDPDGFADMYAQTIAYGLLSARVTNPKIDGSDGFASQLPVTNPFLKELLETFLHVGGRRGKAGGPGIDFDELGVSEVVELLDDANMEAVVRDFGDRNPQEDPIIHFYEHFLAAYDKQQKVQRGVFYTPRPVVSYIVRSVDELLRAEFGLEDGLADTMNWGEMAKRHKDLEMPEGVSPEQDFVQILDPATGTGTFLVEVIDLVHKTLVTKWNGEGHGKDQIEALWNEYVPKHLLPRLHGYELLMAPYAIAHLKIGLKLFETGYRFGSDERARIYLTNALEPAHDFSGQFEFAIPALAHEAQAVNAIKREQRFTVVLGNPPYSSISANMNPWIREQANHYITIDGERIVEKSKRNPLQNDYVKFLRLGHMCISDSHIGVLSMVTSSSYIDGRTLRGMRWHWLKEFSRTRIVNLQGDSKKHETDSRDENVFDITEGVAICQVSLHGATAGGSIEYGSLEGPRLEKCQDLENRRVTLSELKPTEPFFLFRPVEEDTVTEFLALGPAVDSLFPISGAGLITNRDHFATAYSENELLERMRVFADPAIPDDVVRSRFQLKDNSVWKLPKARKDFMTRAVSPAKIAPLAYRPFDKRLMYYDKAIVFNPRWETMTPMLDEQNLAIVTTGQVAGSSFNHAFVAICPVEKKLATHYGASVIFPMYRGAERADSLFDRGGLRLNLSPEALLFFPGGAVDGGSARKFLFYMYSILYSPRYRSRYAEGLRNYFPRIPLPGSPELTAALARIGGELVAVHLMESPELDQPITTYSGPSNPEVGRVGWSDDTVWLDAAATKKGQPARPGTIGFRGVPEAVWNFHIGGYQVCHKWLKDRKGRTLSEDDITHYQKIVVALSETIRLMGKVDEVIEEHGGWPRAFAAADAEGSA